MAQYPHFKLTDESPELPEIPITVPNSQPTTFDQQWFPLIFFWLARCLSLVGDKKARQGFASRLNRIAVLYELHDHFFEELVKFSRTNNDWRIRTPEVLGVRGLEHRLKLSRDEVLCVAFSYLCSNSKLLEAMLDMVFRYFVLPEDLELLSKIVGVDAITIEELLIADRRLGALRITESPKRFQGQVFRMSKEVSDRVNACQSVDDDLLADVLNLASPASVKLEQFSYLNDLLSLLKNGIDKASTGACAPLNILFIGAPGTGKTELVKSLAEYAKVGLLEVPVIAADSRKDTSTYRLTEFERISLMIRGGYRYHILFDEVEDVLRQGWLDEKRKAWINQILEHRHTSSYWICNSTRDFESSFLRRFDLVIPMPEPDFHSRMSLLTAALPERLVKPELLRSIAYRETLTPALIGQMGDAVTRFSNDSLSAENIINIMLPQRPAVESAELGAFDLNRAAIDSVLTRHQLKELCSQGSDVSILISGISGSGKTALARYLCHQCNGSAQFVEASSVIDHMPQEFNDNLNKLFLGAIRSRQLLAIDNLDHLLTAIMRVMPSPHSTLHRLANQIKTTAVPIIVTLGTRADLSEFPMIETAIDYSIEMKLWDAVTIRAYVEQWSATMGLTVPPIDSHCTATPRQLIRALRVCRTQEDAQCLNRLLADGSTEDKRLLERVC